MSPHGDPLVLSKDLIPWLPCVPDRLPERQRPSGHLAKCACAVSLVPPRRQWRVDVATHLVCMLLLLNRQVPSAGRILGGSFFFLTRLSWLPFRLLSLDMADDAVRAQSDLFAVGVSMWTHRSCYAGNIYARPSNTRRLTHCRDSASAAPNERKDPEDRHKLCPAHGGLDRGPEFVS